MTQLVAVNFNGARETIQLLESVRSQIHHLSEVIIVDNGSTREDLDVLQEFLRAASDLKQQVKLVLANRNLGYFGGLNFGLQSLSKIDAPIVVCNNDLEFCSDFFEILNSSVWGPEVFVLAPDVVTSEGYHQNPHVVTRIGRARRAMFDLYFSSYYIAAALQLLRFARRRRKLERVDCEMPIHMGIGACYVLTETFFSRYTALSEEVFLWGEEAVLSNQVVSAGGITLYTPRLRVRHLRGKATLSIPKRKRYRMVQRSYRSYRRYL